MFHVEHVQNLNLYAEGHCVHVFFLVFLMFAVACNRPDAHPEQRDPIFLDIGNDRRAAQKEVESLEKEKLAARNQAETAQVQTGEVKAKWANFHSIDNQLDRARQRLKFLELQEESRKKAAQTSYAESFSKGEPWPDPKEFADYLTKKRLNEAPKDWNQRLKSKLDAKRAASAPEETSKSH
jgi:hypothetical protein